MQKTLKRIVAFVMAVAICISAMPFSAFAAEIPADVSSAEAVTIEPDEPELTATTEPDDNSSPRGSPDDAGAVVVDGSGLDVTEPAEGELAPGTELDVYQVWPAPAQYDTERVSASVGTNGTLFMWDDCLSGTVGTLPAMNEHVGAMPLCAMMIGDTFVAA